MKGSIVAPSPTIGGLATRLRLASLVTRLGGVRLATLAALTRRLSVAGLATLLTLVTLLRVRRVTLLTAVTTVTLVVLVTLQVPVAAQRDVEQAAIDRCEQALKVRMGRELGGRSPDAIVDQRRARLSRVSNTETGVNGTGRFTRDGSDRGRSFTFDCTYSRRNDEARATYRWSEAGDDDGGRRPGSDDNRPGDFNRPGGGATPNGRLSASGGIFARHSGKSLDVQDRSTRDGANVQQWAFADATNQRWDVIDVGRSEFAIMSQSSNKALDVENGSESDGAAIVQHRWRGIDSQRWRLERVAAGYYQIVNVRSRKCLDVTSQSRDDGAKIQQWTCSGNATNQAWRIGRP